MARIIFISIIILIAIAGTTFWHKKIDPSTTWIYAIYATLVSITCIGLGLWMSTFA